MKLILSVLVIVLALIGLGWLIGLGYAFLFTDNFAGLPEGVATPGRPVISPSGAYQLQIVEGNNGQYVYRRFEIALVANSERSPEVVFLSKDSFQSVTQLYFLWDDNLDRVWVHQKYKGTFYWERESDEVWIKKEYQPDLPDSPGLPDILKDRIN